MAIVDFAHREIIASIVYFGPPGSGTSSNVLYLYEHLEVEEKSPIHHFAAHTETHESRFFDYMPLAGGDITGFTTRIRIYSLPGDIRNPTHRDEILNDVDGLVFVADSRQGRETDNTRYLLELESSMQEQSIAMASLPMVFQLNHGDAPNVVEPKDLGNELNPYGFPVIIANALNGRGVLETHQAILKPLLDRVRKGLAGDKQALRLNTVHHGNREKAEDVIRRHINAIRKSEAATQDKESIEEATRARIRRRHAHLKPQAEMTLPWVHPTLGEAKPFMILESAVENNVVRVDVLVQEEGSKQARRVTLNLKGRTTPSPMVRPEVETAITRTPIPTMEPKYDLPPVIYGVVGLIGGLLIGVLVAFLIYG